MEVFVAFERFLLMMQLRCALAGSMWLCVAATSPRIEIWPVQLSEQPGVHINRNRLSESWDKRRCLIFSR